MPKYLFEAKYTQEGMKGLQQAGAASRAAAITDMCSGLGGSLESFYFAFGTLDALVVCDLPDDAAAAGASFTIRGSAPLQLTATRLLTLEEADTAIGHSVSYRPPGS